jgi:hypothetical protein
MLPISFSASIAFIIVVLIATVLPRPRRRRLGVRRPDPKPIEPPLPNKQDYYPRTPRDAYYTFFLLRQKLPPELAYTILEDAEYWLKSTTERTEPVTVTDRNQRTLTQPAGLHYLSSEPIATEGQGRLHPVRKVVFTITSRDQGWADNPALNGTYEQSYTWFEAVTRGRDVTGEKPHSESRRIATNLRAGKEYKTHTVALCANAEDEGEKEWVKNNVKRGHQVDLTVWARYPGWENHVAAARIEVFTSVLQ